MGFILGVIVVIFAGFVYYSFKKSWFLLIPTGIAIGIYSWINLILVPITVWFAVWFLIIVFSDASSKHDAKVAAEKEKAEEERVEAAKVVAKQAYAAKIAAEQAEAAEKEAKIAKEKEKAASDFANSKKTKAYVINPVYFHSLNKMLVEAYAPDDIIETIKIITPQAHSYELIKIINPKHLKDAKIVSSLKILIRNSMLPSNAIAFKDIHVVTIAPKPFVYDPLEPLPEPDPTWAMRGPNDEPSMEEILYSIRKIIREDDKEAA